jgi:hypothetical protein
LRNKAVHGLYLSTGVLSGQRPLLAELGAR